MEDAAYESEPGEWALDCMQMRDFCMMMDMVKSHGIKGIEEVSITEVDRLLM
jgi:hypothetical protein